LVNFSLASCEQHLNHIDNKKQSNKQTKSGLKVALLSMGWDVLTEGKREDSQEHIA
jgi:hypothetical protein